MWLLKNMAQNGRTEKKADKGKISSVSQSFVTVQTAFEHRKIPVVCPYGLAYVPAPGEECVTLPLQNGQICIGAPVKDKELQPGEIILYSAGGATLVLKNDGTILANGKVLESGDG